MTARYYPIHNRAMMILTCYFKGELAWAMIVEAGYIKPADDGPFTYTLEAER